jgi:hypothetical protein
MSLIMTIPNFIVIGAWKAGTTSLYRYLKQHPQIYMSPIKETNFFALMGGKSDLVGVRTKEISRSITKIEDYLTLFRGVSNEEAIGEVSPRYLYSPKACERIRQYIPGAKLIVILRDPVERAYSSYLMYVSFGIESCTNFSEAIKDRQTWGYHGPPGFYYEQIKRYFKTFNQDHIRLYLYDDWETKNPEILKDIFRFLGVDDTFVPEVFVRYEVSGFPRNRVLSFLLSPNPVKNTLKGLLPASLRRPIITYIMNIKNQNLIKPPLPSEVRRELISVYRDDILKLQDLIQRDLSNWLE